jgi:hypothetical protein
VERVVPFDEVVVGELQPHRRVGSRRSWKSAIPTFLALPTGLGSVRRQIPGCPPPLRRINACALQVWLTISPNKISKNRQTRTPPHFHTRRSLVERSHYRRAMSSQPLGSRQATSH